MFWVCIQLHLTHHYSLTSRTWGVPHSEIVFNFYKYFEALMYIVIFMGHGSYQVCFMFLIG